MRAVGRSNRYRGWRALRKRWRHAYVRLLRSPGAPREVAGGLALGLFLAMLPVLQTPLALAFAELMRRAFGVPLSRVAAVLGVCLTNPLTAAPLYGLAFWIGRPLARGLVHDASAGTGGVAVELFLSLLLGGALLGLPISLVGYRLCFRTVTAYQARRALRRATA